MSSILRCSDVIPGCTFVAKGETREEALARASEHVRLKHKFRGVSPEVIAIIYGAISDEKTKRNADGHFRNIQDRVASELK
jgi:predicted small metal-binding protein